MILSFLVCTMAPLRAEVREQELGSERSRLRHDYGLKGRAYLKDKHDEYIL